MRKFIYNNWHGNGNMDINNKVNKGYLDQIHLKKCSKTLRLRGRLELMRALVGQHNRSTGDRLFNDPLNLFSSLFEDGDNVC